MTYTTDNRWNTGSGRLHVPDDATAAYGARWIDRDYMPADVVPDRQGLAYNTHDDKDRLLDCLAAAGPAEHTGELPRDETVVNVYPDWTIAFRRSGGYVYVDAWLNPWDNE